MKTEFTPGPWKAADPWSVLTIDDLAVASTFGAENGEANARLIAAAPDLLAALQAAIAGANFPFSKPKLHKQCLDAIAKAVGP